MDRTAAGWSLRDELPEPLPASTIIALNKPKTDLHTYRSYEWHGWTFELPPGVFMPGATSRMIHERVADGRIETRGRRYAAMGVGLGVEAMCAGLRGAREIYAIDVHPESVRTTQRYYAQLVGGSAGGTFVPVVGDLFDGIPDGVRLDVVTFNPPAVSQPVSEDPDIVRNVCAGTPLLARFFEQLATRELLAPGGEVFVIASNTADLREIVRHAERHGFVPEVHHLHEWHDEVRTYVFRLHRERAA